MVRKKSHRPKTECPQCHRSFGNLGLHQRQTACGNPQPVVSQNGGPPEPPGTIKDVGTGRPYKVPWTRARMEEGFPKVMLMSPPESQPVTFCGVRYDIEAGQDIEVPAPIAAIYRDYLRGKNLPVYRPRGGSVEDRANIIFHQGYGGMAALEEES